MKKLIIILSILPLLLVSSCSDFLSEYSQTMIRATQVSHLDEVLLGSVYITPTGTEKGMSYSKYNYMNAMDDDINMARGAAGAKDEGALYNAGISNVFGVFAWQLIPGRNYSGSYTVDDSSWKDLYTRINYCNVILHEIVDMPHSTEKDSLAYLRVQGETHFLRASFYFMLTNLYSNAYSPDSAATKLSVPLKLTYYVEHDKNKDTQFQRATQKEIFTQIVNDLVEAEQFLTKSPQIDKHSSYRASKTACDILLSRVYLYMQDWKNAELYATKAFEDKQHHLASISTLSKGSAYISVDNPDFVFSQGNNCVALSGYINGTASNFCVSRDLYDIYDSLDARKYCFFSKSSLTDSISFETKYKKIIAKEKSHVSDTWTLRMSEAYLNKMEALCMQHRDDEANTMLNSFRKQRIKEYIDTTYTGEELANQIRIERRRELCFEGQRWFDLRRYAVNTIYPYKREILHTFYDYDGYLTKTRTFKLLIDDPNYTFALPSKTLEFDDVQMPDNERFAKEPIILPTDSTSEQEPTEAETLKRMFNQ